MQTDLKVVIQLWKNARLIKEVTDVNALETILANRQRVYLGIDPTADSLHLGHLVPLFLAQKLHEYGCEVIVLLGDATARIGDPSFRTKKRTTLNPLQIKTNAGKLQGQIATFFPHFLRIRNSQWYQKLSFVNFLSQVGSLFTVNKILEKESLSHAFSRDALFYSDFSYILLQAYDFYYLWKYHHCNIQIGGSDQYPNIIFGIDLIRKLSSKPPTLCGITTNLLLNAQGKKFSKSSDDQIWLDLTKTTLHQHYQFFYNLDDATAGAWNQLFLLADPNDIPSLIVNNQDKKLQKQLFTFFVKWLFGEQKLFFANNCLKILCQPTFTKRDWLQLANFLPYHCFRIDSIPCHQLVSNIFHLSKTKAVELIQNSAIKINNYIITNPFEKIERNTLPQSKYLLLQKGKKQLHLVAFFPLTN